MQQATSNGAGDAPGSKRPSEGSGGGQEAGAVVNLGDFAKDSDIRAWLDAQGLLPPPARGLPANYVPEMDYPTGERTPELSANELRWNDALVRVLYTRHVLATLGALNPGPQDLYGVDKTRCFFWCHACNRVKTLRRSRNVVKDVADKYTAGALSKIDDKEEAERLRKALDNQPLDQRDLEFNAKTGGQWYLMCGTNFQEEGRPRRCRKWEPAHSALSKWPGWVLLGKVGNRALPIVDRALGFKINTGDKNDEALMDEFLGPGGREAFARRMVPADKRLYEAVLQLDASGFDFTSKLIETSLSVAQQAVRATTGGADPEMTPASKRGRVAGGEGAAAPQNP